MYGQLVKGRCIDYHLAALLWKYEFERKLKQRNDTSYACTLYLSESYILYNFYAHFGELHWFVNDHAFTCNYIRQNVAEIAIMNGI